MSAQRGLTDEELFGLVRKTKAGATPEAVGPAPKVGMTADRLRLERNEELTRLLAEALTKAGLSQEDIVALGKSAAAKVAVARELRSRTLASSSWLAKVLHLGSASNVRKLLR